MTVATYSQPNHLTDTDSTVYKGKIDGGMAALAEVAANFAPHEAATPDMTVVIDAGKLFTSSYIAISQQTTALLVAPVTNPRIDRVAIDVATGDAVVITGIEAASPVAPDYAANHYPVCQFQLETSAIVITNSMVLDERVLFSSQYQEDTFTVAINVSSGSVTMDTAFNKLSYIKSGRLVTVSGRIQTASVSAPSGYVFITGLPFNCANRPGSSASVSINIFGINFGAPITQLVARLSEGDSRIQLADFTGLSPFYLIGNVVQANTQFYINFSYFTDD